MNRQFRNNAAMDQDLPARWRNLNMIYGVPDTLSDKWWTHISREYGQSRRIYHTLHHIEHMFKHYDDCLAHIDNPPRVAYAIFFHDVIYDPESNTNEEMSAELLQHYVTDCHLNEKQRDFDVIKDWIILTKNHVNAVSSLGEADTDIRHSLDFDLSILGSPVDDYEMYTDQIREEYRHVPDNVYKQRRRQVLERFLQCEKLFSTSCFQGADAFARINMKSEIHRLTTRK